MHICWRPCTSVHCTVLRVYVWCAWGILFMLIYTHANRRDAAEAREERRRWRRGGGDDKGCRTKQAPISALLLPSRRKQLTWMPLKSRQNALRPTSPPANQLKTSPSLPPSFSLSLSFTLSRSLSPFPLFRSVCKLEMMRLYYKQRGEWN